MIYVVIALTSFNRALVRQTISLDKLYILETEQALKVSPYMVVCKDYNYIIRAYIEFVEKQERAWEYLKNFGREHESILRTLLESL